MITYGHEQLSPTTVSPRTPRLRDQLERDTEVGDGPGSLSYVGQRSATLRESALDPWGKLTYGCCCGPLWGVRGQDDLDVGMGAHVDAHSACALRAAHRVLDLPAIGGGLGDIHADQGTDECGQTCSKTAMPRARTRGIAQIEDNNTHPTPRARPLQAP